MTDLGLLDAEKTRTFAELRLSRAKIFRSTLPYYDNTSAREQEIRQTGLVEPDVNWTISIAREDFPDIKTEVDLKFKMSSAQTAWLPLMQRIRKTLGVEFIDNIVEKEDLTPVYNIMTMRDQGEYFVRQREASAVLEAITTGKIPDQISWPITKFVNSAQYELRYAEGKNPIIAAKVKEITDRPKIRKQERESMVAMLNAKRPKEVLDIVYTVMTHDIENGRLSKDDYEQQVRMCRSEGRTPPPSPPKDEFGQSIFHDTHVDIVNVHRLAFESLNRLATKGYANEMADCSTKFICDTIYRFQDETDIIVIGLKLLSDFSSCFHRGKAQVLHCIMDCVQAFSPPPTVQRPRRPKRLIPSKYDALAAEIEKRRLEEEELRLKREEEERLRREEEARLIAEEIARVIEEERQEKLRLEEIMAKRARARDKKKNTKAGKAAAAKQAARMAEIEKAKAAASVKVEKKSLFGSSVGGKKKEEELPPIDLPEVEIIDHNTIPIIPLPSVPGVTFRGISRLLDIKTCLLHSVAALHAFACGPFVYRELIIGMYVHEEIAEIALVLQERPSVLAYICWTLDRIYSDGVIKTGNIWDDISEDPSAVESKAASRASSAVMGISIFPGDEDDDNDDDPYGPTKAIIADSLVESSTSSLLTSSFVPRQFMPDYNNTGAPIDPDSIYTDPAIKVQRELDAVDDDKSIDPLTGKEIHCVSEITMFDLDLDLFFDDLDEIPSERVNWGDPDKEYPPLARVETPRSGVTDVTNIGLDLQGELEYAKAEKIAKDEAAKQKAEEKRLRKEARAREKAEKLVAEQLAQELEEERIAIEALALAEDQKRERGEMKLMRFEDPIELAEPDPFIEIEIESEEVAVVVNEQNDQTLPPSSTNAGADGVDQQQQAAITVTEIIPVSTPVQMGLVIPDEVVKTETAETTIQPPLGFENDGDKNTTIQNEGENADDAALKEPQVEEIPGFVSEAERLGVDVHRKLEPEYRARYLKRPEEIIIISLAMIQGHSDIAPYEKEIAQKWLNIWDDATLDFKAIVEKGINIASL